MIKSASEIRSAARAALSGHWAEAALLTLGYCGAVCVFSGIALVLEDVLQGCGTLALLLLLPLEWSYAVIFLLNARGEDDSFREISRRVSIRANRGALLSAFLLIIPRMFDGYRDFVRIFTTTLLTLIYICLWTLLFIIPGIIKSLSYAMTPFVLRDNPEMKNNEAIELSMKMMNGHKGDLFWLYLTFIGWGILCTFTLGIGYFWFAPYVQASTAQFYEEVKADYELKRER